VNTFFNDTGILGQVAALGTAFCWAGSALFFEAAGRRIGSVSVNILRLPVALLFLGTYATISRGQPVPTDATPEAWSWLAASGLVGFVIGDLFLFRAFVVIGPRLSSLIMSSSPIWAALISWIFLGEELKWVYWLGMALTVGGIAWAVLERAPEQETDFARKASPGGVLLAIGGAWGQAAGLVLAKHGMGDYHPVAATQIRVLAALAGFIIFVTAIRYWWQVRAALRDVRGLLQTGMGAFFGPFAGVSLSLLAVQKTEVGVAATLMATTPLLIIPLVVFIYRERVGPGGVAGAVLAVVGAALLFR
jgi:drug/metabolite transporter (DMT)-like permease